MCVRRRRLFGSGSITRLLVSNGRAGVELRGFETRKWFLNCLLFCTANVLFLVSTRSIEFGTNEAYHFLVCASDAYLLLRG